MKMAQITIDLIALFSYSAGYLIGKTEVQTWIVIVWILIALIGHIREYKKEK